MQNFDNESESIVIEIDKNIFITNSDVIIAVTYRIPQSSEEISSEGISDILNTIQKDEIYSVTGDLNIDFWKSVYKLLGWCTLLQQCISSNKKPTIVTEKSAAIINNNLINNCDVNARHIQGI